MIKAMILVLSCLLTYSDNVNAGVMYKCIDSSGRSTFTGTPQEGMKCAIETQSLSDTSNFTITAKEFLKPKPGVEDYDVTVQITYEGNTTYNVIATFNQNDNSSHKVDAEEAFFFSAYVVKYFGLSRGFSGFDILQTQFGRNDIKYSIVLNKTGSNLKQNDNFNKNIRPEFLLSGK